MSTQTMTDFESKLRALGLCMHSPWSDGCDRCMTALRAAAALAFEHVAAMVEGDCDCQSYADDFRALSQTATGVKR